MQPQTIKIGTVNIHLGIAAAGLPLGEGLSETLSALREPAMPEGIPQIGSLWKEQGGVLAGIMPRIDGRPAYYLIVPIDAAAAAEELEWGNRGTSIEGLSSWDGKRNTEILAQGNHPAAKFCADLQLHGFDDWYLPSRREASLCAATVPEEFDEGWHWTSTQFSADGAFSQDFRDGGQLSLDEDDEWRVRAVRRVIP